MSSVAKKVGQIRPRIVENTGDEEKARHTREKLQDGDSLACSEYDPTADQLEPPVT